MIVNFLVFDFPNTNCGLLCQLRKKDERASRHNQYEDSFTQKDIKVQLCDSLTWTWYE